MPICCCELMFEGKVKAALRLITQNNNSGALHLDIKDELVSKHPPRQPAVPGAILTNNTRPDIHPVVFIMKYSSLGSTNLQTHRDSSCTSCNSTVKVVYSYIVLCFGSDKHKTTL